MHSQKNQYFCGTDCQEVSFSLYEESYPNSYHFDSSFWSKNGSNNRSENRKLCAAHRTFVTPFAEYRPAQSALLPDGNACLTPCLTPF